jgi:hypothetical protein
MSERIGRLFVGESNFTAFGRILTELYGVIGEYLPYPLLSIGIYQKAL